MTNNEYSLSVFLFFRMTWVQRCLHRATADFGSVSIIPRHPDTRLSEVQEALNPSLFRQVFVHIPLNVHLRRTSGGPTEGLRAATDAEPQSNALVVTPLLVFTNAVHAAVS